MTQSHEKLAAKLRDNLKQRKVQKKNKQLNIKSEERLEGTSLKEADQDLHDQDNIKHNKS